MTDDRIETDLRRALDGARVDYDAAGADLMIARATAGRRAQRRAWLAPVAAAAAVVVVGGGAALLATDRGSGGGAPAGGRPTTPAPHLAPRSGVATLCYVQADTSASAGAAPHPARTCVAVSTVPPAGRCTVHVAGSGATPSPILRCPIAVRPPAAGAETCVSLRVTSRTAAPVSRCEIVLSSVPTSHP